MSSVLKVTSVTQKFGGLKALSDINMHIEKGEIVGIIGPNGAGKTTLFNIITGIYNPTEGKVELGGRSRTSSRARALRAPSRTSACSARCPRWTTSLSACMAVPA